MTLITTIESPDQEFLDRPIFAHRKPVSPLRYAIAEIFWGPQYAYNTLAKPVILGYQRYRLNWNN